MLIRKRIALIVALLAILTTPVLAAHRQDTLGGGLGTFILDSTATQNGSVWSYDYVLTYVSTVEGGVAHVFVVGNPNNCQYSNATSTGGFTNPSWPTPALEWLNGSLSVGNSATFHYESAYAPDIVPVNALVVNSGTYAVGYTLGMGTVVPEPGCLAGLGTLVGLSGFYFRRGRKK